MTDPSVPPSITVCPNGPLLLRGDVELFTVDGEPIPQRSGAVALCRCGYSRTKPYCDGTHKRTTFRAE